MLKLNRTTEYGLIALSYIRGKTDGEVSSAREIADKFALPFEILAKTLQRLKEQGLIASSYGTRGGYILAKDLNTINLADFLTMMEGPLAVVNCAPPKAKHDHTNDCACEYANLCNIRPIMASLNDRLYEFLHHISIEELTRAPTKTSPISPSTYDVGVVPSSLGLQGEEP